MTILMTTDTIGGVWTYALDLAAALERRNVQVVLATMGPLPSHEQRRDAAEAGVELHESDFRLEWMAEPWEDVAEAGRWLLELERRFTPGIVHLNGYAHAALEWRAPVIVVAHSCVCTWWEAVHGCDAPEEWNRYRAAVREGLLGADAVVAPTAAMLAALQRCHGSVPRSEVIFNGRDDRRFANGCKEHLILTAGRMWDEAKNVQAIEAVAGELDWPVYVAGPDDLANAWEGNGETAVADGRGGRASRCLGSLPPTRIAEWMSRAAIYVLPARYEPFGLSALEAALSGCALVLADLPSLREVWNDAACYVDPEEPGALRRTIQSLIGHPHFRRRMARRARRRARRYTADAMAEQYLKLYRRTLSTDGRVEGAYSCES